MDPAAPGGRAPTRAPEEQGCPACKACPVQSQRDYVLRTVEERGIRFVQLWFTDVLGTPKGFNITSAELDNALDEGMTFDGSAIDGFSRVQESDMLAKPDAKTFQLTGKGRDAFLARNGNERASDFHWNGEAVNS